MDKEPLCAFHLARGEVVEANVADHVEPHKGDLTKFWYGELQSLCSPCHDGEKRYIERGPYGYDEAGKPLDPDHPWAN